MTTDAGVERVLEAIRRDLGAPTTWGAPIEMRESLALCALNSAYSLRATSASVRNVLDHYRQHRRDSGADPDRDSGPELLRAMDAVGGPRPFSLDVLATRAAFPNTGRLRAEAVYEAVSNLAAVGVADTEQLRANAESTEVARAWRTVKGLGPQSWSYLLMNAGVETLAKPDTMVQRFLARATGSPVGPAEAVDLVTEAAALLNVPARSLDRAIWLYETPDQGPTGGQ